jgi:hypothetical protein
MTNAKSGPGLGETCKAHLLECWIEETYGRRKEFTNKYVQKGLMVEENSLTLYSRVKKKFYKKNEETFRNDFIIGTPDLVDNDIVTDIKSSWDLFTFYAVLHKPTNKVYEYQLTGYMDLTKRLQSRLAYCLINTPDALINDQKRKLSWQMGLIDPDLNDAYQDACNEIDKANMFDDIPIEKRYIELYMKHSPDTVEKIYTRVKECREFLNSLS